MSSAPRIRRRAAAAARAIRPAQATPPAPALALLAVAAGGAALLALSAVADSSPVRAAPFDARVRRLVGAGFRDRLPAGAWWWPGGETRRHAVAESLGGLAGDWTTLGAGALGALLVARHRGLLAALPAVAAAPLGNLAHGAVKYRIERPRPITARLTGKQTPSFPSGHAARGAAAAGILAYLAAREGLLPPRASLALGAAIAFAGGAGRVYVDRHWATDTLGGWGLGTTVAALAALGYDAARARRDRRDRLPDGGGRDDDRAAHAQPSARSSSRRRRAASALAVAR